MAEGEEASLVWYCGLAIHGEITNMFRRKKRKISFVDIGVVLFVLLTGIYMAYRINIGLQYKWDWGAIPQYFNNVRWIFVQRMDVLSQAISFCIAEQTSQWVSYQAKSGEETAYHFENIRDRVLSISDAYAASLALMGLSGITPYHLTYEHFLLDPVLETKKLSAFLGVDHAVVDTSKLHMEKQANKINEAFKTRFIRDFRSWMAEKL
jgi:LPS sulfotransferase NodH